MSERTPKARNHGRTTTDEINARTEAVARLLALHWSKTEIHREAERLWGCHWKTTERYVGRARARALAAYNRPKEDHIVQAIAFNQAVLSSDDVEWRDKLAANKDISELLGLYPPKTARLEGSGPGGGIEIINQHIKIEFTS